MVETDGVVMLIVRANASRCPVITYQANILAESGVQVVVLETSQSDQPEPGAFDPRVRREVMARAPEFGSGPPNLLVRWQQSTAFARNVRARIQAYKS